MAAILKSRLWLLMLLKWLDAPLIVLKDVGVEGCWNRIAAESERTIATMTRAVLHSKFKFKFVFAQVKGKSNSAKRENLWLAAFHHLALCELYGMNCSCH